MNEVATSVPSDSGAAGDLQALLSAGNVEIGTTVYAKRQIIEGLVLDVPLSLNDQKFPRGVQIESCVFNKAVYINMASIGNFSISNCEFRGALIVQIDGNPDSVSGNQELKIAGSRFFERSVVSFGQDAKAELFIIKNFFKSNFRIIGSGDDSGVLIRFLHRLDAGSVVSIENFREAIIDLRRLFIEEKTQLIISGYAGAGLIATSDMFISDKASVDFIDSAMYGICLARTNLTRIGFHQVRWPVGRSKRRSVFDDLQVSKAIASECLSSHRNRRANSLAKNSSAHFSFDEPASVVVDEYRQLVTQFEARRDFDLAEEFYVNEMELKRTHRENTRRSWIGRNGNVHALYKVASLYGASYKRAISVLILLTFLFSAGFMFLGMNTPSRTVDYSSASYRSQLTPSNIVEDSKLAVAFTLSIATLQKDKPATLIRASGSILASAATVTLAAQGALLLFSLRRRFRRSSI